MVKNPRKEFGTYEWIAIVFTAIAFALVSLFAFWMITDQTNHNYVGQEAPVEASAPENSVLSKDKMVELTAEEQAYLKELGAITMGVDPDWMPYEKLDEEGRFIGIAADLLALVSERIDTPLSLYPTKDWEETLELSRKGEFMIIPFLNQTPARDEWLIFTEPIFTDPNVFITRQEHPFVSDPAALRGKSIALPIGTSMEEFIRSDYPNLEIIASGHSEKEIFEMVENGEADMALRSLTVAAYTIRKEGFFNLKIAGQIPEYTNRLRIGVFNEYPELRDILDKAVATITTEEREQIVNRHVYIPVETPFNYKPVFAAAVILLLFFLVILAWNYRLNRLNQEKRILLDTIQTQIWYLKNDRTYGMVNRAFADFNGLEIEDLAFRDFFDVYPKDIAEAKRLENSEIFKTGKAEHIELEQADGAGSIRTLSVYKAPYLNSKGRVNYVVCSAEDITRHRFIENKLLSANRELEAYAHVASHDLKGPISVIKLASHTLRELLNEGPEQASLQDVETMLDAIETGIERANNLITGLLELAQAGQKPSETTQIDIKHIVETVLEENLNTIEERKFDVRIDPDLGQIEGNENQMYQIFTNLISNSLKYNSSPMPRLSLELSFRDSKLNHYLLCDNGPGIPENELEIVFQPLYKGVGGGAGIGLSTVEKLVNVYGGSIHAYNDGGACFEFSIGDIQANS